MNSGQAAGQFLSGLNVPDGVYTQVRVTPHPSFNIQGNDGARYTLAANGVNGGCTFTNNAALAAEYTITLTPLMSLPQQRRIFQPLLLRLKIVCVIEKSAFLLMSQELFPTMPPLMRFFLLNPRSL